MCTLSLSLFCVCSHHTVCLNDAFANPAWVPEHWLQCSSLHPTNHTGCSPSMQSSFEWCQIPSSLYPGPHHYTAAPPVLLMQCCHKPILLYLPTRQIHVATVACGYHPMTHHPTDATMIYQSWIPNLYQICSWMASLARQLPCQV